MAPRSRIRGRQTCDCICGAAHVVFIVVVVEQAAPTVGKQRVGGGELLGRLLPGAVQGRAAQGSTEHVSELVVGDCGRAGSAGGADWDRPAWQHITPHPRMLTWRERALMVLMGTLGATPAAAAAAA